MVDEMKEKTGLPLALRATGLAKSTYYYSGEVRGQSPPLKYPLDPGLVETLQALAGYELTLGYRKVKDYIATTLQKGHYNHKKVYRHMKALGRLQPKRYKKRAKPKQALRWYSPIRSNVRWEGDLSYVGYEEGTAYAFCVIDTYDKELIGHTFGLRARAEEAVTALDKAIEKRFPEGMPPAEFEVVLRIDRGCQYTAALFCEAAATRPWLKLEFCGVQAPNDKPFIESFFACYKREEVYRNDYQTFFEARSGFSRYLDWYINRRPHGSLGNLSPAAFRAGKGGMIQKNSQSEALF